MATGTESTGQRSQKRARKGGAGWRLLMVLLIVGGALALAYLNQTSRPYVLAAGNSMKSLIMPERASTEAATEAAYSFRKNERKPWDKLVRIEPDQVEAIGLKTVAVQEAKAPIKLALNGITQYDPETLTQIRLRFDSLVTKVRKTLGDPVAKGDSLVDLYSNELATAKSDYQSKYVQWLHDRGLYESRQSLMKENLIKRIDWTETVNNEAKSWIDYQLAYDKLSVYGLSPEEITPLLTGLDERSSAPLSRDKNELAEKASTTLRSPAEGIIIKRDVVQGNYYEPSSVLMVIAPLDHLRVYANVYESDLELVQKNQEIEIQFPYQDRTIVTKVDNIASQVDPDTHAMRIRATIQNPARDLKSDMLVYAVLHITCYDTDTLVPRNAIVATNNKYYVFVKQLASGASGSGKGPLAFERRRITLRQERSESVIVSDGLKAGEEVVTTSSLILAQMYEDMASVENGATP
ncbi:MAG TPA: efflux RND transporter periplasmic adaptor subunit [Isosphaeraceae bacterium]|jgi:cobalt-zinc-cadmium efflux system membrane fusion protein|nr:efflux RND transporter periplasmic adaptor subunit [Isosphaeraceae bacterium]